MRPDASPTITNISVPRQTTGGAVDPGVGDLVEDYLSAVVDAARTVGAWADLFTRWPPTVSSFDKALTKSERRGVEEWVAVMERRRKLQV